MKRRHSSQSSPLKKVRDTLDTVSKHTHRTQILRHALTAAACSITCLAVIFATDWFAAWQHPMPRWICPLIWAALTGWLVSRVVRTVQEGPDTAAAAAALDKSDPKFQERWTTFAALQPGGAGGTGSSTMRDAIGRELEPMCEYLDLDSVDRSPFPTRWCAATVGAIVLLAGFIVFFFPQGSPRLAERFVLPWANLPLTRIAEVSDPPPAVLKGSSVELEARTGGKIPGRVWLELEEQETAFSAPPTSNRKQFPAEPAEAVYPLTNLQHETRYRFRGGDAVTPWRKIEVTTRPRLVNVAVQVQDPSYSSRPPREWNRLPRRIEVIRGSVLSLNFQSDLPLARAALELENGSKQSIPLGNPNDSFQVEKRLIENFGFRPSFESEHGFANLELPLVRVVVKEDRPPKVKLTEESSSKVLSSRHDFQIAFEANDDLGIQSAEAVFSIRNKNGKSREVTMPIELGDQAGKPNIHKKANFQIADLPVSPGDQVSYSVRVRDNSQQTSSLDPQTAGNRTERNQSSRESPAGPDSMTKRPLQTGGGSVAESQSKSIQVTSSEIINQVEPKKKLLLAVDDAFRQLKSLTENALQQTRNAKAPEDISRRIGRSQALHQSIRRAKDHLTEAAAATKKIREASAGTPYAFLGVQLDSITHSYLNPAKANLEASVRSRLIELPPREIHRGRSEMLLVRASTEIESLHSHAARARSKVEQEAALADMMTMYLAQVEDIPILLSGQSSGSPYHRTPGEVSREQAEAALKRLESKKSLYRKTAELLRQHPELWKRYLDKSKSESSIYRDQLEDLAARHEKVRSFSGELNSRNSAADQGIRDLIRLHQNQVGTDLLRSFEKAQIWVGDRKSGEPTWLTELEKTARDALKTAALNKTNPPVASLRASAEQINSQLDSVISALQKTTARQGASARSLALRLGELRQARFESGLASALVEALQKRDWRHGAFSEEADIARQTQQLAGKIELEGARLSSLSAEAARLGEILNSTLNSELMPALEETASGLKRGGAGIESARAASNRASEAFSKSIRELDQFVLAAIRELDKAPAKANAGVAGAPSILANSLEELQRKLEEEKEMSESFGIPCCRPTNFQVTSDWDQSSNGGQSASSKASSPSSSAGPPQPANQTEQNDSSPEQGNSPPPNTPPSGPSPPPAPKDGLSHESGTPGKPNSESDSGSPGSENPGKKRSELEVADTGQQSDDATAKQLAELARAEALRQARELAEMQNGSAASQASSNSSAAGDSEGSGRMATPFGKGELNLPGAEPGSDWNRLSSTLKRELLQEESIAIPEPYRQAIEAYFRDLSKWKINEN